MTKSILIAFLTVVAAFSLTNSFSLLRRNSRSPDVAEEGQTKSNNKFSYPWQPDYVEIETAPPKNIVASRGSDQVLECEATGGQNPTIHWLKDGVRTDLSVNDRVADEDANVEALANSKPSMRLATVRSKLYLDCVEPSDAAKYQCVVQTSTKRAVSTASTLLIIDNPTGGMCSKKKGGALPPRVDMWSSLRIEYENRAVQLFCRAEGRNMKVKWYYQKAVNADGSCDYEELSGDNYQVLKTGDLLIKNALHSRDLGTYKCEVSNDYGSNAVETDLFLFGEG